VALFDITHAISHQLSIVTISTVSEILALCRARDHRFLQQNKKTIAPIIIISEIIHKVQHENSRSNRQTDMKITEYKYT